MLMSNLPRLVIRPSNKHIRVQFVEAGADGDRVLSQAFSQELSRRFKWEGATGNLPSAYLTGLLAGHRAKAKGIAKAVVDTGLSRVNKGSRTFAALKGASDSGIDIPHSTEILPSDERIKGQHITDYYKQIAKDSEALKKFFTRYASKKVTPENITKHLEETKRKVIEEFSK